PEVRVRVKRAKEIVVRGLSEEGKEKQMSMKGLLARVIQHEIDHLKGVLIIDYLHFIKRFLLEYRFRRGKKG
ncbi:MAG: peptide deformylase, partial [Candidatus Omnitrophota bacterium]